MIVISIAIPLEPRSVRQHRAGNFLCVIVLIGKIFIKKLNFIFDWDKIDFFFHITHISFTNYRNILPVMFF